MPENLRSISDRCRRWFADIAFAFTLLVPAALPAAPVQGLYETVVPVADKTDKARIEAMRLALRQVAIKLTGDRQSPARIGDLLQAPQSFITQYRYRDLPQAGGTEVGGLWVHFDPDTLEQALVDAGLPLWGRERPAVLIWLAVQVGTEPVLVGGEDEKGFAPALKMHAERRGLALILPLLDLDDSGRISAVDVQQGNAGRIADASVRYNPETTVTALLSQVDETRWQGRFVLDMGGESTTYEAADPNPDAVLGSGMDSVADAIAGRYASASSAYGESSEVEIRVDGIGTADQYAEVQQHLRNLNTVTSLSVRLVEPDRVTFVLQARGGMQAVAESIALRRLLQPLGPAADGNYRLLQ